MREPGLFSAAKLDFSRVFALAPPPPRPPPLQLAAQARAQNSSDRESLQAHKEKIQKEVGAKQLLVTTVVAGAAHEADGGAAAAAALRASHKAAGGTRDAQAAAEDTMRPGKVALQVQKDRGPGRARALGATAVTQSSSWSIGAQAARLAQAQSAQAQLVQTPSAQPNSAQPRLVRALAQAATAVQAPSTSSTKAGAAATASASADGSPPQLSLEGNRTHLEAEKARVREKLLLVEKELLQLENKETEGESSPAAADSAADDDDTADTQPLLPPAAPASAPAPAVVRPTASPPAGLPVGGQTVADVLGGVAKTNSVQAPFATATIPLGSASASVNDASPAVAAPAVAPSDRPPSNDSAGVADASRAVTSAGTAAGAPACSPAAGAAGAAAPVTCVRVGQQVLSPGGGEGGSAPGLEEELLQSQVEEELTATGTSEATVADGALRQAQNMSTLAMASLAPPFMGLVPPPSTNGGGLRGSQVVGASKATAVVEDAAMETAAASLATATMSKNNGNASMCADFSVPNLLRLSGTRR